MLRKTTLANGIRVVSEQMNDVHSVSVGIWVENGSRHETVPLNGISHFLEHMLFKGTSSRSALEIAREADSFGGVFNAFTSREFSCYYAKVLSNRLPEAVNLLSDLVLNSTLDENEMEKERRVILQEVSMIEETPEDRIHDLFCERIWYRHPLGLPVLGNAQSVSAIRRQDLSDLLAERYLGQNIIITAAGHIDHDSLCRRVERAFERVVEGNTSRRCQFPDYRPGIDLHQKPLEQLHLCYGCKGLPQSHPDRFVLQVLNTLLGASMSSRLFQQIRDERGLAYSIYSYLNAHSDAGALVVYCATAAHEARQVFELIQDQFRSLVSGHIEDREVAMAREQLKGNLLLSQESSDNRMSRLARNEIYHGYQPAIEAVVEMIEKVDAAAVTKLANDLFSAASFNLQAIGNITQFPVDILEVNL